MRICRPVRPHLTRLEDRSAPAVFTVTNAANERAGSLRAAILAGRLGPGARLPSSRELAGGLGVSRATVVGAFELDKA